MIVQTTGPSLRARFAWAVRLTLMELRGRRAWAVVGLGSFALLVLAVAISAVCFRAWRAGAGEQSHVLEGQVQLVALLREDLPAASRNALATALRQLPGVAVARVLEGEQALARMRQQLGDRASVLDGVEEGFLPASLEIVLQPGDQGVGLADAFAWRLRRMDGVVDVDVVRTAADQNRARAAIDGHHLAEAGLTLGLLVSVLAIGLAATSMRRPSSEGRLLAGFGFTPAAMAFPAAVTSVACAIVGGTLGVGLTTIVWHWGGVGSRLGDVMVTSLGAGPWVSGAACGMGIAATLGTGLGWWGARSSLDDGAVLAAAD